MRKLGFVSLAIAGFVGSAQAVVIDDYSTGSYNSGYISSGFVQDWTTASGAVGGIRTTYIQVQSNTNDDDARLRVLTTPGVMTASSGPGVDAKVWLAYGLAANSVVANSNPLNLDLSSSPIITFDFVSNDIAFNLGVELIRGDMSSAFMSVPISIATSPATFTADFTAFAGTLSDVDSMIFTFDTATGGDFSLTKVEAVPEPASMIALGIGAAAMLRRKRNK